MNYAYLNANGDVICVGTIDQDIPTVQDVLNGRGFASETITEKIDNAPGGLKPVAACTEDCTEYSRKIGGTGTDPGDYETRDDYLANYKTLVELECDAKTEELCVNGVAFDGEMFSTSKNAQLNWTGLKADRDRLVFPLEVPKMPLDGGLYTIPDLATFDNFCDAIKLHIYTQVYTGQGMKVQIKDAADRATVDALRQANQERT